MVAAFVAAVTAEPRLLGSMACFHCAASATDSTSAESSTVTVTTPPESLPRRPSA